MNKPDNKSHTVAPTLNPDLCSRLKQVRKALGISQTDFAASVGISQGHLCCMERQERAPSLTLIKALCHQYGISEKWLLTGEGERFLPGAIRSQVPVFEQLPDNFSRVRPGDKVVGYLSLPGLPDDGFAFYQRGEHMAPTIQARDLMVCEFTEAPANGDLVLVKNRWGAWIVRRMQVVDGKICYAPDNPEYRTFECLDQEPPVLAKVSMVLRNVGF